jgi:hypothetical protein
MSKSNKYEIIEIADIHHASTRQDTKVAIREIPYFGYEIWFGVY